ncbi:MAG: ATP-binding protein [Candidatus Omnitrophica bacterium]|nr:ATP-binding protein [Candidatus Omnitrophota bacterium]
MNIKIIFTRAGIFLAVYTIVLGIPFIVLKRTGSGLLATSLAVIFATIGPLVYRFLQMKAESAILAQQRRYQRILLRAAVGMVTEHDLARLSKRIVFTLKNTIRLNFSAIFIRDKKNNLYQLKSIRGESNIGECVKSFAMDDPFIDYLKENHGNFFFENAPEQIKGSSNILSKSKIVIPVLIGEELFGFVFLGEKINTHPYSNEDINVFKILSRQAALAIENCIFFEESKDSQQRMFAAEKLASIGGMADGIAHQIKNRLNLFSLAGGEIKIVGRSFVAKHAKLINSNPELDKTFKYLDEIAVSIMDNVKRTDSIIKGILDFAKVEKKENLFGIFSFKETIELSSLLLMLKHEAASLPLSVKIDSEDAIYGVKSQLTEVIYNLLDNAYEAIKERKMQSSAKELESFVPAIELSLTRTQDHQIIKISDNGIGIKEEDKPKVFAPFFTTKTSYKSGSGIGAYVVKRIIEENHKGKIWFTSEYMKGTSFIIELPKKPAAE